MTRLVWVNNHSSDWRLLKGFSRASIQDDIAFNDMAATMNDCIPCPLRTVEGACLDTSSSVHLQIHTGNEIGFFASEIGDCIGNISRCTRTSQGNGGDEAGTILLGVWLADE